MLSLEIGEWKVKFRVYETKKCRKCRRIHPVATNRVVFHQDHGTEHDVAQAGHAVWVKALEQEKGYLRPYFQYTIALGR